MVRFVLPLLLISAAPTAPAVTTVDGNWEGEAASDLWPTYLRIEAGPGSHGELKLFVLGQTIDLGTTKNATMIDSVVGEGAEALHVEARVKGDHLVGSMTESGKSFAFSLQRIPTYPLTRDRVVGWSRDLDAIRTRVLTFDRSFDEGERAEVINAIAQLRSELPRLSDDAVRVRIARITTLANNAHTRLYFLRNRTEVRRMPIRVWWFGSQLRVVRAAPAYSQYLGCRIDRVGKFPVMMAKMRVDDLFAGSPSWRTYMSAYSLTSPEVLHGVGIIPSSDNVTYRFGGCASGSGTKALAPLPLTKSTKPLESWWDLAPRYAGAPDDWKQVLRTSKRTPLYLRHPDRNYWFESIAPDGTFYIQYNRAADAPDESLADFSERAGKAITFARPRALVVDLRFNTGGNGSLTPKLVDAVKRAPGTVPVYVITGRATFSAGIVAAALLRQARPVKIVGEPVGDSLEFWAEGGNIVLPYSGLYVHFANGAHSLSPKPCPTKDYCDDLSVASLAPDVRASPTWASYRANRDVVLEAVVHDLQKRS